MLPPTVEIFTTPPKHLLALLNSQLPYSLPLLRRLQFTSFRGGITTSSRILLARHGDASAESISDPSFAAAYVDFSRDPETVVWMYSSLEYHHYHHHPQQQQRRRDEEDLALSLVHGIKRVRDQYAASATAAETGIVPGPLVFVGTLSETLRIALANRGCAFPSVDIYDKWVWRVEDGPADEGQSLEGMRWGEVRREDIPLIISRSKIPRKERTLVLLPSATINLDDGTPIVWCYLGPDASLSTLYCEEPYRRRGLARAVAVKLLRSHVQDYGLDGFCSADVAPDNLSSQKVCRSLGGKIGWSISWSKLDLDHLPDE